MYIQTANVRIEKNDKILILAFLTGGYGSEAAIDGDIPNISLNPCEGQLSAISRHWFTFDFNQMRLSSTIYMLFSLEKQELKDNLCQLKLKR